MQYNQAGRLWLHTRSQGGTYNKAIASLHRHYNKKEAYHLIKVQASFIINIQSLQNILTNLLSNFTSAVFQALKSVSFI